MTLERERKMASSLAASFNLAKCSSNTTLASRPISQLPQQQSSLFTLRYFDCADFLNKAQQRSLDRVLYLNFSLVCGGQLSQFAPLTKQSLFRFVHATASVDPRIYAQSSPFL